MKNILKMIKKLTLSKMQIMKHELIKEYMIIVLKGD